MEDTPKESKNYPNKNSKERLIRSFGRIKSRKLSDHKSFLLENLLPLYEIKSDVILADKLWTPQQVRGDNRGWFCHPALVAGSIKKLSLEIGFGFGDFLFEKAKNNPDTFFIGSEPHLNGIVNLLSKLEKESLPNLKISQQDVRILTKDFPAEIFDEIYILFPDPWPKLKHFKRRLINAEFLDFLSTKIKSRGKLIIATDHDSYKTWILSVILKNKNFEWLAQSKKDWQIFPGDWTITKYQKKAALEGRVSVIFNLIKNV